MNIILFTERAKQASCINISHHKSLLLIFFFSILIPGMMLGAGYYFGNSQNQATQLTDKWQLEMTRQQDEVSAAAQRAREDMDGLAVRLGQVQAQAVRLNALGQRLVEAGDLDKGEFDFTTQPAQGGPIADAGKIPQLEAPDFVKSLETLANELKDRERQLRVMEAIFMNRELQDEVYPAGKPIQKGWISSYYGMRTDPFTGKREHHKGMDFAGKLGSNVVAVAGGVVTWSGDRYGYGQMVEVNHGNGYITRYAHNHENLAKAGDMVTKGQTVAYMGSSGRSTGPHVHFEVIYKGRVVDPAKYIVATKY